MESIKSGENSRYLFFTGAMREGGAERVISILSQKMACDRNNVKILLYYEHEPFYSIDPDIEIVHIKKETGSANVLKNLLWMHRYFRKNADVVVSFLAPFNMLALIANLNNNCTVIVADRNDPRYVPDNRLMRFVRDFLYRFANGVVLQTKNNQAYFSKLVQRKSTVIYNPVDFGDKAGLALRTPKKKKIVSVGRLMPQKNQSMLIDAFAKIHKDFPEYTLVIYGEGPCRTQLEQQIDNLGMKNYVQLPGSVKDIPEKIADAQLFVLSSHYEGMPNALIEAMCLGLPVISTAVSGATDLIENEKNGIIVDCGDVNAMTEAMIKVLRNPEFSDNCARCATGLAEKLTADKICAQWENYARQVQGKQDLENGALS